MDNLTEVMTFKVSKKSKNEWRKLPREKARKLREAYLKIIKSYQQSGLVK